MFVMNGLTIRLVLKGIVSTIVAPVTMIEIMPKIRPRMKVVCQRLLTSFLLRPKLSKAPLCSTIIVGITNENIMAIIIPGAMKKSIPIATKIPVTNCAGSNDGSLDIAKLKLTLRFEVPFSIWSAAFFTTIPVVVVPTIHDTRPDKIPITMIVEINAKNHGTTSS